MSNESEIAKAVIGGTLLGIVILIAVLILDSSSPPDKLNGQAEALPGQISEVRRQLDATDKDFKAKLKTDKYAFMDAYSREQQHADLFDDAKRKLDAADKVVKDTINPILDDYDEGHEKKLQSAVTKATGLKNDAKRLIPQPAQWLDKVAATKANPAKVVTTAKSQTDAMVQDHTTLQGVAAKATATYPKQKGEIDRRFKPFTDKQTAASEAFARLQTESKKNPPNYALMTEDAGLIATTYAAFTKEAKQFRRAVGELPVSVTHTLLDLRVESELEIERTSWYEGELEEFPDEHSHIFTRKVNLDTADYFAQFPVDTELASACSGFSVASNVDENRWHGLKITHDEKWPDGDNCATYDFGGLEETFCHKLMVLRNGEPDTSGRPSAKDNPDCRKLDRSSDVARGIYWVEVDVEDFRGEDIGMSIYSKGVGDFADQATTAATPPGMVYVGDPATGEWQTDSDGNEFWAFYGQYMFFSQLIGGPYPYHYRYEYDSWGRSYRYNDRDYYAGSGSSPRYGANSPQVRSRFPGSNFNKSGLRDATVRGAGPAARGGGPGGGGK